MRSLVTVLAVVAMAGTTYAAITIDGSISDWAAKNQFTDSSTDGWVENWGFFYESTTRTDPGFLYWYMELKNDWSTVSSGNSDAWPGLWIDCDHYSGTVTAEWGAWRGGWLGTGWSYSVVYKAPSAGNINTGWSGPEWKNGVHQGIDIEPELGINTSHWGEGWNYWGWQGVMGVQGHAVNGGQVPNAGPSLWQTSGKILEGRIDISNLITELKTYPDFVAGNFLNKQVNGLWKVAMREEGHIATTWHTLDATSPVYAPIIADGNNDGQVTLSDFTPISTNFLKTNKGWEGGDYNLDGLVDLKDFAFLSVTYLKNIYNLGPSGGGAVPEPITLALLGLGGLLLRRRS